MAKRYWLIKSEPTAYSIDDLKRDKATLWEGVRNYQARNFMMKEMNVGDEALFYHSSAEPPGAVGVAEVSGPAEPDPTQFDTADSHFCDHIRGHDAQEGAGGVHIERVCAKQSGTPEDADGPARASAVTQQVKADRVHIVVIERRI